VSSSTRSSTIAAREWRNRRPRRALALLVAATVGLAACSTQRADEPPAADASPPQPSVSAPAGTGGDATATAAAQPTSMAGLDRELTDSDDFRGRREELVEGSIAAAVEDSRIVEAFRAVPRHAFVPTDVLDRAYADFPLPIGYGQTISQPSLVAMMTELVDIDPDDRVLEIGTGSGFQAAILRELTDEVYSVEIVPELTETARAVLEALGYGDIRIERRDGYLGWPEEAPFDAIVVTAAPDHLPRPLVDQLRPDGGRMVIPIGPVGDVQTLWLVTRQGDEVDMREVVPVRFVPLTREDP
jgi:protein-L-isoaspartate(D-aspartate) O-methyltransferase